MFRYLGVVGVLLLGACETREAALEARADSWRGRPITDLVAHLSQGPDSYFNPADDKRVFLFRRRAGYGECGITVDTAQRGKDWVIRSLRSECPPGAF